MLKYRLSKEEQGIVDRAAAIIETAQERARTARTSRTSAVKRLQVSGLMEMAERGIVAFAKMDGCTRVMFFEPRATWNARDLGTKHLTVFDLDKGDFRKVNLETVTNIEIGDTLYKVID